MSGEFLKGYRALDLTGLSGQLAGRMLADLGMEVIKIEPPGGDPVRNLAPFITSASGAKLSTTFAHLNAGKASKVLDLDSEAGCAAFKKLVESADVVLESFQPGELDGKGLGYKKLAAINPGIVMGSITGFGQTGPKKNLVCNDLVALAESGFLYISGDPKLAPCKPPETQAYYFASLFATAGVLAALYRRERTGCGGMVSTSLLANGLWWNAIQIQAALCGARVVPRPPREEPATALANLYRCADGRWFLLNLVQDERDWPALLAAIERTDLANDGRFTTGPSRRANARALIQVLDAAFATRPWTEWREILNRHDLTYGAVATVEDARSDRQMVASGALVPFDDPRGGAPLTVSGPVWVEGVEKVTPRFPPELGEHSVEILRDAGYSDAEIEELRAGRVIVQSA